MAKAKKVAKKVIKLAKEDIYTDILEERFMVDGNEMVKKTYMNGNKVVKEETVSE